MTSPITLTRAQAEKAAQQLAARVVKLEEALQEITRRGDRRSKAIAANALGLKRNGR